MKKIHKIKLLERLDEAKFNTMERDQMNELMGGEDPTYYQYLATVTLYGGGKYNLDPGDVPI